MRVRLIDDNEAAVPVPIGDSVLHVRRIPQSQRREIEAARRREFRRGLGNNDREVLAQFLQAVEDDLLDYAIERWEGLEGDPACTRENKARLPESAKAAVRIVADAPNRAEDEAESKNSGSPSAG